jgi:transcriptional regulator of acetoin/glycerol metabolism
MLLVSWHKAIEIFAATRRVPSNEKPRPRPSERNVGRQGGLFANRMSERALSNPLRTTADRSDDRARSQESTPSAVLHVLHSAGGSKTPQRKALTRTETVIGRAASAQGSFPDDPFVSRHHATLHVDTERRRVRLVDHSRTGTFVAGRRISDAEFGEGEVVRVGDTFFLLRFEANHPPDREPNDDFGLVGASPQLRAVRKILRLIAASSASVLILGESGTGKELAARALHAASGRRGQLVALNCGAIPDALAESQLFGHVAGAFTGARSDAPGFFRSADGGTLFLDEVGELPALLQPKLLRALEDRVVVPLGSTRPTQCDVRFVAATNRDLREPGRFRADLLARICDFVIEMPPLRERREDVLPMLDAMLEGSRAELCPELVQTLLLAPYPHNARDLRRIAIQLRVRGGGRARWDASLVDGLAPTPTRVEESAVVAAAPPGTPVPTRHELEGLIRHHRGCVSEIARATGRSRRQVRRWIDRWQLG